MAVAAQADGGRRRGRRTVAPLVLCYHAISPTWEHMLAVSSETLRAQLERFLQAGFRPVTAEEAFRGSGKDLHVTFDDAFGSVLEVMPILEQLGVPATVFACSGYADAGMPLTVPELRADPATKLEELRTLDWHELRALAARGVEIGSHTVSHARLPLTSDAELVHELGESKRRIEREIGRPCRFLAYPYGDHDRRVRAAARAAGYHGAFSLPVATRLGDPFQLGRVGMWRGEHARRVEVKASPFFRTELGRWAVHAREIPKEWLSRRRSRSGGVAVEELAEHA